MSRTSIVGVSLVAALAVGGSCARAEPERPREEAARLEPGAAPLIPDTEPRGRPAPEIPLGLAAKSGLDRAVATTGIATIRDVTIPAGTVFSLRLETGAGSRTSRVEDPVRAVLRSPVRVGNATVLPAGTAFTGHVTNVRRPGRVKGRASVSVTFHQLVTPDGERYLARTSSVSRTARGTKRKDALKIGVPAAGGAIVGGIVGGKKGAAIGGAVGGGAGTAAVLTTRGPDVYLRPGTIVSVRLRAPLTVRIRS